MITVRLLTMREDRDSMLQIYRSRSQNAETAETKASSCDFNASRAVRGVAVRAPSL
jgi:hypothetical protein